MPQLISMLSSGTRRLLLSLRKLLFRLRRRRRRRRRRRKKKRRRMRFPFSLLSPKREHQW